MSKFRIILGIETSCDDTGIALYDGEKGLIAHAIHRQLDIHAEFGGVVPELASRDHIRKLTPLLEKVCKEANIDKTEIDGIAYTKGPGLIGSLFVGACFAKALGFALGIPVLGIHHLEGHLLAPMLETESIKFPFLALLVSGGHTMLLEAKQLGEYVVLGDTLDDAVGEAFDKTAKLLGLPYPGGPHLAALATTGIANSYTLPKPMLNRDNLDFSFSGLKTAVLRTIQQATETSKGNMLNQQTKADIACSFQDTVVEILVTKCKRALAQTNLKQLIIAGGVGANQALRAQMAILSKEENVEIFFPQPEFCTDNGAMIAYAGYQRFKLGQQDLDYDINVKPRWSLTKE